MAETGDKKRADKQAGNADEEFDRLTVLLETNEVNLDARDMDADDYLDAYEDVVTSGAIFGAGAQEYDGGGVLGSDSASSNVSEITGDGHSAENIAGQSSDAQVMGSEGGGMLPDITVDEMLGGAAIDNGEITQFSNIVAAEGDINGLGESVLGALGADNNFAELDEGMAFDPDISFMPSPDVTPSPEAVAEDAPEPINFMLGGMDVLKVDYDMDALWQQEIDGHQVNVSAFSDIDANTEGQFGFEYKSGVTRGIGVKGGGDNELQNGEGISIDFDGVGLNDLTIGVRALFEEGQPADGVETGNWVAYLDGAEVGSGEFDAQDGTYDGKAEFSVSVDGGFDRLDFSSEEAGADYHIEYVMGEWG